MIGQQSLQRVLSSQLGMPDRRVEVALQDRWPRRTALPYRRDDWQSLVHQDPLFRRPRCFPLVEPIERLHDRFGITSTVVWDRIGGTGRALIAFGGDGIERGGRSSGQRSALDRGGALLGC